MSRTLKLSLLMLIITTACADLDNTTNARAGLYRRASFRTLDSTGKVMKPNSPIDDVLPTSIRLGADHSYEVDARILRGHGTYRIERDSIFFDDGGPNGIKVVSLLGRQRGDTLYLSAPGILLALGGGPGMDLRINFVRKPDTATVRR